MGDHGPIGRKTVAPRRTTRTTPPSNAFEFSFSTPSRYRRATAAASGEQYFGARVTSRRRDESCAHAEFADDLSLATHASPSMYVVSGS